eukprot:12122408-Heterocapsa_arctica.AAC.1
MGLDDVMEKAAAGRYWAMTDAEEKISRFLHALLAQLVHGKALAIVRLAPKKNGIAAWHNLVAEYEPALATRWCAQLAELLSPGDWSAKKPAEFLEALMTWERKVAEYEISTGVRMPEPYKCATIMRHAPVAIRQFLRMHPEDV